MNFILKDGKKYILDVCIYLYVVFCMSMMCNWFMN